MNLRSTNARTIQDTFWKLETLKKKIPTARKFPPPITFLVVRPLFKVLFLVILDCNDCNSFHISDSFSHRYVFFWFLTGISQEDYRAAVRAGADIFWFCPSCSRPDADPVAESTRISESETDILESEEFNPPLPSSDSDFFESTVYEPPAQTISPHLLLCILMYPDLAFTLGKVLQMKWVQCETQ